MNTSKGKKQHGSYLSLSLFPKVKHTPEHIMKKKYSNPFNTTSEEMISSARWSALAQQYWFLFHFSYARHFFRPPPRRLWTLIPHDGHRAREFFHPRSQKNTLHDIRTHAHTHVYESSGAWSHTRRIIVVRSARACTRDKTARGGTHYSPSRDLPVHRLTARRFPEIRACTELVKK